MRFHKLGIRGAYRINLQKYEDFRGSFMYTFCEREFESAGIPFRVVQAKSSFTHKKSTIRGMHFQTPPKEENKIVQYLQGRIYDVILDLRRDSPTYLMWCAEELKREEEK